jgi:hypothetical protein
MAYFVTDDRLVAVARYFMEKWAVEGLPTTVAGDLKASCAVAAFSTREATFTEVVLMQHRGRTLGVVLLGSLGKETDANGPFSSVAMEGALYSDPGGVAPGAPRAALLLRSVAQARKDVEAARRGQGFHLVRSTEVAGGTLRLEHARGKALYWTYLQPLDEGVTAMVETRSLGGGLL